MVTNFLLVRYILQYSNCARAMVLVFVAALNPKILNHNLRSHGSHTATSLVDLGDKFSYRPQLKSTRNSQIIGLSVLRK